MKKLDLVDAAIGGHLRNLRRLRGLTQSDIAAACGITYQHVQKYEKGTNRLSASRIVQIAAHLGVKPSFFLDGVPHPQDQRP